MLISFLPFFMASKTSLASLAKEVAELKTDLNSIRAQLPNQKPSRFVDNGDGTVTDKETNLTWMKQDDGKKRSWADAKKYCEENQAKLPGEGWRMPTVNELFSLVDHTKYGPAIDPLFLNTQSSYYWSSTPYAGGSGFAWCVSFYSGGVGWDGLSSGYLVRPVRQNS